MIPIPPAVAEAGRTVGPLWQFLEPWAACWASVPAEAPKWWRHLTTP